MCCIRVFASNYLGYVSKKNWQNWVTFFQSHSEYNLRCRTFLSDYQDFCITLYHYKMNYRNPQHPNHSHLLLICNCKPAI